MNADDPGRAPARRRRGRTVFVLALAVACVGFLALGSWQVQRLAWKRDLIAQVEARRQADPVPAPGRVHWSSIRADTDAYRRVRVHGRFLPDAGPVAVQAVTRMGAGFWWLHALETSEDDIVLVNRGFVPTGETGRPPPEGEVVISGLMRMSEPGGGFLRANDPDSARWFSRDIAAIAQAHDLTGVAPYFVDADDADASSKNDPSWPMGGLTVTRFPDNHLPYALTWFTLAVLTVVAMWRVLRESNRRR